MKNILFVTESYTTAIRLIPVYLKGLGRNDVKPFILTVNHQNSQIRSLYEEYNIKYLTPEDFLSNKDLDEIREHQKKYTKTADYEKNRMNKMDYHYKGIPILPLFHNYLITSNNYKLYSMMLFDKIVQAIQPDALVVAYDSGTVKKFFINRANQLDIPTFHVQYCYYMQDSKFPHKKMNSINYCLWGEHGNEGYLKDESVPNENIFITGNPTFDLHRYDKTKVKAKTKIPNDTINFLVSICSGVDIIDEYINEIEASHLRGNELFIFKIHPNYDHLYLDFKNKLSKTGFNYQIYDSSISAFELLSISDFFLTHAIDTLFCEAFYYDVSVILLNNALNTQSTNHENWVHLSQKKSDSWLYRNCLKIDSLSEFFDSPNINSNMNKGKNAEIKERLFYRNDFNASDRVLDSILSKTN
jgi:hypothetical protein